MSGSKSGTKRLLLVGAGHAHLYSLAHLDRFTRRGISVTVISPAPFWYSGMGPGLLSGQYEPEEASVDIRAMVEGRGGRFLEARVTKIHAERHYVITSDGEKVPYDVLSLNIGSEVTAPPENTMRHRVFTVKPVHRFLEMRKHILTFEPSRTLRISLVGGGPAGCEAAAAARSLCFRLGYSPSIRLFTGGSGLLSGLPSLAGKRMADWCRKNEILVDRGRRLSGFEGDTLVFEDHSREESDITILATGVHPPDLVKNSELAADGEGALRVDPHLQSLSHPGVFGGGDCIHLQNHPLARVGVYAVRQGPVLFANLFVSLFGGRMRTFSPQKRFVLILNLSDGTGLLVRGRFVVSGRIAFLLKRWLDRRFVRRFQSVVVRTNAK
ncbi:MAG: FAD-dependent oxidoreductase [Deltaproteobacteria bacterium]|nr:FAD-dependent oxidoreductase [Deltaproteobacteria bacterium]